MFVKKGYCRYGGRKCRHMKVEKNIGICKKDNGSVIRNEKTGEPKIIPTNKHSNIKAPWWCPKL